MNILKNILKHILKHKIIYGIFLLLIIIAYFAFSSGNKNSELDVFVVKRGNVISEVSVTGVVKPVKDIDLAFEVPGKIKHIYVDVGDKVKNGQILASLNNDDLNAQLIQAKASYDGAVALLDKMKSGAREEEVKAKEFALKSSEESLSKYYLSAIDVMRSAYEYCNDGVRNKIDYLFNNDETDFPSLSYKTSNFQSKIDAEFYRLKSRNELNDWKNELSKLNAFDEESVESELSKSVNRINTILTLYSKLQDTLNGAIGLSNETISLYKTNVGTAVTNAVSSLTSINTAQKNIKSQKIQVNIAKNDLELIKKGYEENDIKNQESKVEYAKGQIEYIKSKLEKTFIKSPFNGIITKVNFDDGEIVQANVPVMSIIGNGKYQIEANVAESDISKVHIGNSADVTLDAYGDSVIFKAKVIKIDIGATMIEGVATYKTTLVFNNKDERILPGMTANIDILSNKKENVLYIPTRDIITNKNGKFVKKIINEKGDFSKIKIETGIKGSDGRTEVLRGLNVGDKILSE